MLASLRFVAGATAYVIYGGKLTVVPHDEQQEAHGADHVRQIDERCFL
jgi:hypothetical protein